MTYDDDDYDNEDEGSYEYECVNVGCSEDGKFFAAPPEWFKSEGLTPPRNCPSCRAWRDEQREIGTIVVKCKYCLTSWKVFASKRLYYQRHVGNWDEYWEKYQHHQTCGRCLEFPSRRVQQAIHAIEREHRRKYGDDAKKHEHELEQELREHLRKEEEYSAGNKVVLASSVGISPKRYIVPGEAAFYHNIKLVEKKTEHGKTQLTHIMKEAHEWNERFGMSDPESVVRLGMQIARSTGPHVREYRNASGGTQIMKYDTEQHVLAIIVPDRHSPTGARLETVYPAKPRYILDKIKAERKDGWVSN